MNAFTLTGTAPDGSVRTLYACAKCSGHVYKTKESADACCGEKKCARCDGPLDRPWSTSGTTQCSKCDHVDFERREADKEAARFDAAQKVREHDGPVFCGSIGPSDGYFASVEDLLDELAESREEEIEWPIYAWACHDNPTVSLRYEDIIESATQEAPESFEPSEILGSAELIAAIAEFNEANAGTGSSRSWTPNYKVAVLLPTREELAAREGGARAPEPGGRERISQYVAEHRDDLSRGDPGMAPGLLLHDGTRVLFHCPCGCRDWILLLVLAGSPHPHRWGFDAATCTLTPSVQRISGGSECKSHFFITKGQVQWCG